MPERMPTATDRLGLVKNYLSELSHLAQVHAPQAVVEVLSTLYEDEDAHLVVFLPEGAHESEIERLRETLTKRSTEILLDTGLLILAGVYETSQQRKRREEE
jgi:hypothetical protein